MSLSLTLEAAIVEGMGADVVPVTVTEAANRAVVFIDTRSPHGNGSGTLTWLPILGDGRALLLTCNHVIPDEETAKKCCVSIDRYNDGRPGTPFLGEDLFDLSMFKTDTTNVPGWGTSGKLLDFTIIGVKMDVLKKANLPGGPPKPLLLTDYQNMGVEQLKVNDQISVVHFPKNPPGFQRCSNTLNIMKTEGPIFGHSATTRGGSSGCPIFREFQKRWVIVGLHRGGLSLGSVACTNLATHISAVCDAYMDRPYNGTVPDLKKFVRTDESSEDTDAPPMPVDGRPPPNESSNGSPAAVLSHKLYAHGNHLMLLRKHVSRNAPGKGRTLLAALGLTAPQIEGYYGNHPLNEVEAVQAGLQGWVGERDPTWGDLLEAMKDAGIAVQHCNELKIALSTNK